MQIVPGPVPCLIPAYLLTSMGSVIDMVGLKVYHTNLGTVQVMHQRLSGHVEVNLTEFGDGFRTPPRVTFDRSQVWERVASDDTFESHPRVVDAVGQPIPMPPALAALAAAVVVGLRQSGYDSVVGRGPSASTPSSPSPRTSSRTFRKTDHGPPPTGRPTFGPRQGIDEDWRGRGRLPATPGSPCWSLQVPGPSAPKLTHVSTQGHQARGKQGLVLVTMRDMRIGG